MLELLGGFSARPSPLRFRYSSRKHKNHLALAVYSGSLKAWRRKVDVQVTRFAELLEFAALRSDSLYSEPFVGGSLVD
ncbi:hypothetical protein [Cupriavidus sp. UYPR2.512]|uniref:hypothetical protein n=1 Tax=Cupriavidus sp. UYPR2.512 TaxID=1080187 RepID=UPI000367CB6A|nr:hypothetical protein [Cupriavidus sp. UYPR2.512]UIF87966.1 hypothetical protein KAF44_21990 [Cupriavidus necator]